MNEKWRDRIARRKEKHCAATACHGIPFPEENRESEEKSFLPQAPQRHSKKLFFCLPEKQKDFHSFARWNRLPVQLKKSCPAPRTAPGFLRSVPERRRRYTLCSKDPSPEVPRSPRERRVLPPTKLPAKKSRVPASILQNHRLKHAFQPAFAAWAAQKNRGFAVCTVINTHRA
jgi:hypothetical protein